MKLLALISCCFVGEMFPINHISILSSGYLVIVFIYYFLLWFWFHPPLLLHGNILKKWLLRHEPHLCDWCCWFLLQCAETLAAGFYGYTSEKTFRKPKESLIFQRPRMNRKLLLSLCGIVSVSENQHLEKNQNPG